MGTFKSFGGSRITREVSGEQESLEDVLLYYHVVDVGCTTIEEVLWMVEAQESRM